MRRTNVPPVLRAHSQLKSAVRTPPMWRYPVGEGAKRTRTGPDMRRRPLPRLAAAGQRVLEGSPTFHRTGQPVQTGSGASAAAEDPTRRSRSIVMAKNPLALVKERFGEKKKLVEAVQGFVNDDLW